MSEKNLVIDGLELHYKGLFKIDDFLKKIDSLLKAKSYSKQEKRREEIVRPKGKEFSIELRPVKKLSETTALMIKMRIFITNLQKAEILVDKKKKTVDNGDIEIIFDGWVTTDYEGRWEQKPIYVILRKFVDNFIKKHLGKEVGIVGEDTHYIRNELNSYLNMQRFVFKNPEK